MGAADTSGSFCTRGHMIKEMDENNGPVGRVNSEEKSPEIGSSMFSQFHPYLIPS